MTLGQRIQQIRVTHGLSQEEFGEKLDTTRQTVSRWELDQSQPELAKIVLNEVKNDKGEVIATDTLSVLAGRMYNVASKKLEGYKATVAQTGNIGVEDKTIVIQLAIEENVSEDDGHDDEDNKDDELMPDKNGDLNSEDEFNPGDDEKKSSDGYLWILVLIIVGIGLVEIVLALKRKKK